jgi:hypothetical protein
MKTTNKNELQTQCLLLGAEMLKENPLLEKALEGSSKDGNLTPTMLLGLGRLKAMTEELENDLMGN